MEEFQENFMPETHEANVELIYYINNKIGNNKDKSEKLKFNYENEFERISYNDITFNFYLFLKEKQENEKENINLQCLDITQNSIIYKTIRYYDGDGWIELKKEDVIFLDDELNLNNLKIIVYCDISTEKKMNIEKKYDKIAKEINYIYAQISKRNNNNLPPYAPLNLVVLTANPLMDGEKELRTMNDFNIITSQIYKSFDEEDCLKYTKFLPLTLNNLREAITNEKERPVILHLICKSTYVIPEEEKEKKISNNSEDYANLIFEDDINNYNLEFINNQRLEEDIFNYDFDPELKERVKKIILIISTPLAMDVYNIFKKFEFKNILIQHTTLADVNFVANFNYTFYKDIITHLDQPINNIYKDALNDDIDKAHPPAFCCCFHKHKTTCYLVNNLQKELYNDNEPKKIEDLKESIPHFYHLFPTCYYNSSKCDEAIENYKLRPEAEGIEFPEKNFCCHLEKCFKAYKNLPKIEKKDKITIYIQKEKSDKKDKLIFNNYCCCKEDSKINAATTDFKIVPKIHNINYIFQKDFSAENKNNEIRFRNSEITRDKQGYTPNYEKMILSIGNNKVIFEVIKFFTSKDLFLYIYGNDIDDLKKLGNIIIEYYKEKCYYLYKSNIQLDNLNRANSAINLNSNFNASNINNNSMSEDFSFGSFKTSPLVDITMKIDFIQMDLDNDNSIFFEEKNNNKIFFVYVDNIDFRNKLKLINNKIVWFCKTKDGNPIQADKSLNINDEPKLKEDKYYLFKIGKKIIPNEYIKFQNIKNVRNNWRRTQV